MGEQIVNALRLNVIISRSNCDRKFQRKYKSNWTLSEMNEIKCGK